MFVKTGKKYLILVGTICLLLLLMFSLNYLRRQKQIRTLLETPKPLEIKPNLWYKGPINLYDTTVLQSWVDDLLKIRPETVKELEDFMDKVDELNARLSDTNAELYIKMTKDTSDKVVAKDYEAFQENILAYYMSNENKFKQIIVNSTAFPKWIKKNGKSGEQLQQVLKNDLALFREENVPIEVELSKLEVQFRAIIGGMTIKFRGQEYTMARMKIFLEDPDRSIREEAWKARFSKILEHRNDLHALFDKMLILRQQMAKNAGFDNYRDYMHQVKGRFSYSVDDVLLFHDSIYTTIMPIIEQLNEERRKSLGLDKLRPWDMAVSLDGKVLKPVKSDEEIIPMFTKIMYQVDPVFGHNVASMHETGLLDLLNRPNKAPGGYSYPLFKYGASFIFMNAVGLHSDLTTFVHEVGHAMHAFATSSHRFLSLYNHPMEASELASMSMENLSMDHWDLCYQDPQELRKAKREHIEDAIRFLPWCAIVDRIQHHMYTDATTASAREKAFSKLMDEYTRVDWSGLEKEKAVQWMFQLHIFEVPFYYVEYGICQLGALAVYREYKKNPKKALLNYKKFLNTGYRKSLTDIYKAAGIELNFKESYIKEIAQFAQEQLNFLAN